MTKTMLEWEATTSFQLIAELLSKPKDENLTRASELIEELESEHPNDPILIVAKGRIATRRNLIGQSRDLYIRAQSLANPKVYSSPWINEAFFYDDYGYYKKAIALCKHVLTYNPGHSTAIKLHDEVIEKRKTLADRYDLTDKEKTSGDPFVLDIVETLLAMDVTIKGVKIQVLDHLDIAREVDIIAEIHGPSFLGPIPLVIECKDWSRSVDRPVIDKCLSLIDHSTYKNCVVVGNSFTSNAKKLATESGIWLLDKSTLENVTIDFLWRRLNQGPVHTLNRRDIASISVRRSPEEEARIKAAAEERARFENSIREKVLSWLAEHNQRTQSNISMKEDGIYVGDTNCVPLKKDQHSCMINTVEMLGSVPKFVKLILLNYHSHLFFYPDR